MLLLRSCPYLLRNKALIALLCCRKLLARPHVAQFLHGNSSFNASSGQFSALLYSRLFCHQNKLTLLQHHSLVVAMLDMITALEPRFFHPRRSAPAWSFHMTHHPHYESKLNTTPHFDIFSNTILLFSETTWSLRVCNIVGGLLRPGFTAVRKFSTIDNTSAHYWRFLWSTAALLITSISTLWLICRRVFSFVAYSHLPPPFIYERVCCFFSGMVLHSTLGLVMEWRYKRCDRIGSMDKCVFEGWRGQRGWWNIGCWFQIKFIHSRVEETSEGKRAHSTWSGNARDSRRP